MEVDACTVVVGVVVVARAVDAGIVAVSVT